MNTFVSILIPVYNEEESIRPLIRKLTDLFEKKYRYEILFIDDGSTDNSLKVIEAIRQKHKEIHFLSLSRNFGQHVALKAGIDNAKGDCVVAMDADLQHGPENIPLMITKWQEGNDIVFAVRKNDFHLSHYKKLTSVLFYKLFETLTSIRLPAGGTFVLLDKKVVDVVRNIDDSSIFFGGALS